MGYAFDSAVSQSEYDKLDARRKKQYILKALIVEDTDLVRDVLDIKTAQQITARWPDIRQDTAVWAEKTLDGLFLHKPRIQRKIYWFTAGCGVFLCGI